MFQEKISNFFKTYKTNILIIFLSLAYFLVTTFDSYYDVINPDSINWHARSYFFSQALKSGDYYRTYQAYHPGVTLMWLLSSTAYFDGTFYTKDTFLQKDFIAKQSIYLVLTINFFICLLLLKNHWKTSSLVLFSIIYTLEPFLLGVRRLVHLEVMMLSFLILSFLLLYDYSVRKPKTHYLILSSLSFVLAFYTKSSAIIILPVLFLIFIFSKDKVIEKLKKLFIVIFSIILFLYLCFPALWLDPINRFPEMFNKIYQGASSIGYEGKMEVGTSGKSDNLILKKSRALKNGFYQNALMYTLSPAIWVGILSLVPLALYLIIKEITKLPNPRKISNILSQFLSNNKVRFILYSFLVFLAFYLSYSYSVKSYERYAVVMYPFIFFIIVSILDFLDFKIVISVTLIYLGFIIPELVKIHPYYYAYGNSYLGGSFQRYEKLNSPPFGVGTYLLNQKLTEYIKTQNSEYFPAVAGFKSFKAIFKAGRNERSPLCDVDYFIMFYDDLTPGEACIGRSNKLIFTINIGGFDYWKVYKFNRQSTKAVKLNDVNLEERDKVIPVVSGDN